MSKQTNTVAVNADRPRKVALAVAATALCAAGPAARAGLTFTNNYLAYNASEGAVVSPAEMTAIAGVEADYARLITSNLNVTLNLYATTAADFGAPAGTPSPATVASSVQYGYYRYADFLSAYAAHAASPLQTAAAGVLAANVTPLTDAYTAAYTPANTSNPAFATTTNYPTDGAAPRTVRSAFVNVPLAEARVLGLTPQQNLFTTVYAPYQEPTEAGELYVLNDLTQTYGTYSFAPLGSPVPAGQLSYAKVVAAQIGRVLGLQSGVDALDADRSQGVVLHDVAMNAADNNFEDVPYAEDLFRYRFVNGVPTRDAETGDAPTYFSADGRTALAQLGTGFNYGDGAAASFLDGDAGGVFVTANTVAGQSYAFTGADAAVLNTFGYAVTPTAVPEPIGVGLVAAGVAGLLDRRRRRSQ